MTACGNPALQLGRFLLFVLLCLPVAAARAQSPPDQMFLRGYLEALFDNRFPGLGLRVGRLEPQRDGGGTVTLGAATCLGPSQKREIERLVLATGRVQAVAWDPSADCAVAGQPPPAADAGPTPRAAVELYALPERELFEPLIADPRQPRFSMSYQRYKTPAEKFNAAAFGEYFGFASGFLGRGGASQIGIQAAVFALFNLDAPSGDLINADDWVGFPLSDRRGPWSYLVRLYHQSSHLGDEFILGNPSVERVNLSHEDLEGLVSYEWEHWRLYAAGAVTCFAASRTSNPPICMPAWSMSSRARSGGSISWPRPISARARSSTGGAAVPIRRGSNSRPAARAACG
jgi:hypothetical protein